MALIEGWMPPTRENYNLIFRVWQISYPVVCFYTWKTAPLESQHES